MRCFCDHSSFGEPNNAQFRGSGKCLEERKWTAGITGGAVPDRVMLFRAQALRAAGGNSWRMAHNPPAPTRLDVTDRVGILALDENHFYDHVAGYGVFDPVSAANARPGL